MKSIAVIDEFENINSARAAQIGEIRQQTGADVLVAVMSGNFLQCGLPAKESAQVRAQKALEAGVDVVFERPVYTALTSLDTYVQSGIALLDKLKGIDEICVPISIRESSLVDEITLFLFSEPKSFQETLKKYRRQGHPFYEAQAKVIEHVYPGVGMLLRETVNYTAFECLKALKRMYSRIKPCYLPEIYFPQKALPQEESYRKADGFFKFMKYEMILIREKMNQIYGGSSTLTARLLEQAESFDHYKPFVDACVTNEHTAEDISRFLFHLLLGIGKSDIAMSRMYDSAPYAHLMGCRSSAREWVDELKKKSRIPVIEKAENDVLKMNSTCRELFDMELRAEAIYHMV